MELLTATDKQMKVINGPDEMLLCGLAAGVSGGIGSTYNIMLPWYKKIYECFKNGDNETALEYQMRANKITTILLEFPVIPAVKAVLEHMGLEVGNATFPMKRLDEDEKSYLMDKIQKAGFTFN